MCDEWYTEGDKLCQNDGETNGVMATCCNDYVAQNLAKALNQRDRIAAALRPVLDLKDRFYKAGPALSLALENLKNVVEEVM